MTRLWITALLVLAFAAIAAGCGGDDEPEIPRADAASLRADLLEAKRRLSPLRCDDLDTDSFPKIERRIDALEDGDVKETLEGALDHLRSLVEADCAARDEEPEETDTTETTETTTDTETEPPTTETEPPTTDTQPTTPTAPTTPTTPTTPEENGSGGQGVPQGAVKPGKPKKDKG